MSKDNIGEFEMSVLGMERSFVNGRHGRTTVVNLDAVKSLAKQADARIAQLQCEKAELQRLCERAYLVIDENYEKLSDGEFGPSSLLKDLGKAKDGKELRDANLLSDKLAERVAELEKFCNTTCQKLETSMNDYVVLRRERDDLIHKVVELESRLLQFFNASDEPAMIRELYTKIANLEEESKALKSKVDEPLSWIRLDDDEDILSKYNALVERVKVHNASMIAHRHGMYLISLD